MIVSAPTLTRLFRQLVWPQVTTATFALSMAAMVWAGACLAQNNLAHGSDVDSLHPSFIDDTNYPDLARVLREAGLHPTAVARIISTEVRHHIDAQRNQLQKRSDRIARGEYWRIESPQEHRESEIKAALQTLHDQIDELALRESELIEQALGQSSAEVEYDIQRSIAGYRGPIIDFLPDAKQQKLAEIWREYAFEEMQASMSEQGLNFQQSEKARQNTFDQIVAELNEQEHRTFLAWNSDEGIELREKLWLVEPTRSEFDAILAAWDEKGWNPFAPPSEYAAETEAYLQEVLGAERAALIVKVRQPGYGLIARQFAFYKYPESQLDAVYKTVSHGSVELTALWNQLQPDDPEVTVDTDVQLALAEQMDQIRETIQDDVESSLGVSVEPSVITEWLKLAQ